MKNLFFFVLLCFSIVSFGQSQSGKIIYKVKEMENREGPDSLRAKNPAAHGYFAAKDQKIKIALPYLQFRLDFNQEESLFEREKSMEIDLGKDMEVAERAVRGNGKYYTHIGQNLQLHQFELLGENWLIEAKLDTIAWHLHKDTKTIKGHTTQKATATIPLNMKVKGEITAWFSPALPLQFGPIGISGLPGLILELDIHGYTFYADAIDLSKKNKSIKVPTKGKRATQQEYARETMKSFFRD